MELAKNKKEKLSSSSATLCTHTILPRRMIIKNYRLLDRLKSTVILKFCRQKKVVLRWCLHQTSTESEGGKDVGHLLLMLAAHCTHKATPVIIITAAIKPPQ